MSGPCPEGTEAGPWSDALLQEVMHDQDLAFRSSLKPIVSKWIARAIEVGRLEGFKWGIEHNDMQDVMSWVPPGFRRASKEEYEAVNFGRDRILHTYLPYKHASSEHSRYFLRIAGDEERGFDGPGESAL